MSSSASPRTKSNTGASSQLPQPLRILLVKIEECAQILLAHISEFLLRMPCSTWTCRGWLTASFGPDAGNFLLQRAPPFPVGEEGVHAAAVGHEVARVHRADALEHAQRDAVDQLLVVHVEAFARRSFGKPGQTLHWPSTAVDCRRLRAKVMDIDEEAPGSLRWARSRACVHRTGRHRGGNGERCAAKEPLLGVSIVFAAGRTTNTDVNGNYRTQLPAGDYTVLFRSVGYGGQTGTAARGRRAGAVRSSLAWSRALRSSTRWW